MYMCVSLYVCVLICRLMCVDILICAYLCVDIYIYIYISSSSSCRASSTDFPDPLTPSVNIVQYSRQVFQATSCIHIYQPLRSGRI